MDFAELRGIDLSLWLRGYHAARDGEPFDETRIDPWADGYRYWVQQMSEQKEKSECH